MLQRIRKVFIIDNKHLTVTVFLDGLPLKPRAQSLAGYAVISRVGGGKWAPMGLVTWKTMSFDVTLHDVLLGISVVSEFFSSGTSENSTRIIDENWQC